MRRSSVMRMGLNILRKAKPALLQCSECPKTFQRNRKADLERHMRIHTNEKPYACTWDKCGKSFRQSSALKNHMNFHIRDQTLGCPHCTSVFYDKPTLNRHVKEKHLLQEVFKCPVPMCGKCFKRKTVLRSHLAEKHEDLDFSRVELSLFRVPAAGNYHAGSPAWASGSEALLADQILAQNYSLPSLSMTLPGLSMNASTSSSYFASPYCSQPQLAPDTVSLANPYTNQVVDNSHIDPVLLTSYELLGATSMEQYQHMQKYNVPTQVRSPSKLEPTTYHMFGDSFTSFNQSGPDTTALRPPLLPNVQVKSPSPPPGVFSPYRTVSPSQLIRTQMALPTHTSPQPSLVYSFESGTTSRSQSQSPSPAHCRSRSGTPTSPVQSISRSASIRRQSPFLP